jgi:hypothetical protein
MLLLAAHPAAAQQQEEGAMVSGLACEEAVLTTGVQDRQPVDEVQSVPADVGRVYLWTRITGAEMETGVEHVWYRGDEEMARVPLTVGGSNWRTWSSKNIEPSWTGEWRVDVVGPEGQVLESVSFTVG